MQLIVVLCLHSFWINSIMCNVFSFLLSVFSFHCNGADHWLNTHRILANIYVIQCALWHSQVFSAKSLHRPMIVKKSLFVFAPNSVRAKKSNERWLCRWQTSTTITYPIKMLTPKKVRDVHLIAIKNVLTQSGCVFQTKWQFFLRHQDAFYCLQIKWWNN